MSENPFRQFPPKLLFAPLRPSADNWTGHSSLPRSQICTRHRIALLRVPELSHPLESDREAGGNSAKACPTPAPPGFEPPPSGILPGPPSAWHGAFSHGLFTDGGIKLLLAEPQDHASRWRVRDVQRRGSRPAQSQSLPLTFYALLQATPQANHNTSQSGSFGTSQARLLHLCSRLVRSRPLHRSSDTTS